MRTAVSSVVPHALIHRLLTIQAQYICMCIGGCMLERYPSLCGGMEYMKRATTDEHTHTERERYLTHVREGGRERKGIRMKRQKHSV